MRKDDHLIFESFINKKGDAGVGRPASEEEINVSKADLNKDKQLSDYELARAKAMDKAMHKDEQAESKSTGRGAVNDIVVSELHKIHTALNQMSSMIDLNPSAEVDQLLSKIRDVADMLIAERPAENEESADERKERVQRGWDINKKRWAKWKMENPEAAAKHAAKKATGKEESAENEPHGYPQGMTAIQNLLLNELKKYGFELTRISHTDKERDKYPTVFMHNKSGPMHRVVEISGMGEINGEPYKKYLADLKEKIKRLSGIRPENPEDPYYDTWQSIAQDHAGEEEEDC